MSGETQDISNSYISHCPHMRDVRAHMEELLRDNGAEMQKRAVSERMCRHRTLPSLPGRLDARVRALVRMIFNKKGVELFSC